VGEAKAAVELQTSVCRLPRRIGRQQLSHVRLSTARLVRVVQAAGLETHQTRGLDVDMSPRYRKLHTLILADGPVEHDARFYIGRDLVDEPVAISDAFRHDERALCIEAIQDVLETFAYFANQVLDGDLEIVEEQFVGFV